MISTRETRKFSFMSQKLKNTNRQININRDVNNQEIKDVILDKAENNIQYILEQYLKSNDFEDMIDSRLKKLRGDAMHELMQELKSSFSSITGNHNNIASEAINIKNGISAFGYNENQIFHSLISSIFK